MNRSSSSLLGGILIGLLAGLLAFAVWLTAMFGGLSGLRAGIKYAEVLRVFRAQFVADYDLEAVTDESLRGAVAGLDDRWSYYMNAEEYADYQDYAANRYQGIGVTVAKDEESGGFRIESVQKDAPADQAGIVMGDIILAVDGNSVTECDTEELRSFIQADFGQDALLTVRHADGREEDIPVSCVEVYSNPVTSELLADGTGYVRIENFRDGAGKNAVEAVDALISQGAQRLVFDVRNNPGGQLTELNEILDHLLPEGEIFYRTDKKGNEIVDYSDASCVEMPMAVLMNGESYSAAEFFAAALREYDWAILVGEPTTGKARSQVTVRLFDGSAVHLSKYRYLTPNRVDLTETEGLKPDVEASLSEEDWEQFVTGWLAPADDSQVQAAFHALKTAEIDGLGA